ncbi:hypothetical protein H6P81_017928 [Aristolochia fimbriata]|uniref:Uncharacterized protein n=1 Tax=Aristolochia fimbriata TaxID=158543 RepID=A0AAV7E1F0_ARIFI|nr:hypothetical protein H6P81_017928 [Aristolochia fimbriata]
MWIYFPLNIKWGSQAPGVFDDILNVMKERYVFRYVEGDALVPDEDEEARKIFPDSRLTQRKRLGDDFTVLGSYLSAHRKKDGSYSNDYTRENCVKVERIFHKHYL